MASTAEAKSEREITCSCEWKSMVDHYHITCAASRGEVVGLCVCLSVADLSTSLGSSVADLAS